MVAALNLFPTGIIFVGITIMPGLFTDASSCIFSREPYIADVEKYPKLLLIVVALACFLAGVLVAWMGASEWRPVGDGRSILNTASGELRSLEDHLPDLSEIVGHWAAIEPPHDMLLIGKKSIAGASWAMKVSVVDHGKGWWVVETQYRNGVTDMFRLELSPADRRRLTYKGESYYKVPVITGGPIDIDELIKNAEK